jgi:hypothetical protein
MVREARFSDTRYHTPRKLARFEAFERVERPGALLAMARSYAAENIAEAALSDLPTPEGAVAVHSWEVDRMGTWSRFFSGTTRRVGPATVAIHGEQVSDGRCERCIGVHDADELTPAQMRALIAAGCAAVDEMDGWDGRRS